MEVVALLAKASTLPLPQAAARYAASGIPVFPCVPGEKRPLTEHGFHDATTNARTVRAWWARSPTANIAIPTGAVSGIDVVDIDNYPHGSGFAAFERARRAALVTGWAALVRTPSGGIHAYYPADQDRRQQSWQAPPVHIDFRGDGGYIIAPPSVIGADTQHAGYAMIATAKRPAASIDAGTLHTFLTPLPTPSTSSRGRQSLDIDGLARWVAGRGEGERNRALFWAACRAAETGIAPDKLQAVLDPAAHQAGLGPRETATTIRSALRITATHAAKGQPSRNHPPPEMDPPENGLRML